jgi:hypothetical protein
MTQKGKPLKFIYLMKSIGLTREISIVHASYFASYSRAHLMARMQGFTDALHLYSQELNYKRDRYSEFDERD